MHRDPFSFQFSLTLAFCEALHTHNLYVLSFKVVDGSLPLRSWLAPSLGNWPDWITTTPGVFASKIIFSQIISSHHFNKWSHNSLTCTVSDRSKQPGLGQTRNKCLIYHYCPNSDYKHSISGELIFTFVVTEGKSLCFSPCNCCCWLWGSPGLVLVSTGSFVELIQLPKPEESLFIFFYFFFPLQDFDCIFIFEPPNSDFSYPTEQIDAFCSCQQVTSCPSLWRQ